MVSEEELTLENPDARHSEGSEARSANGITDVWSRVDPWTSIPRLLKTSIVTTCSSEGSATAWRRSEILDFRKET